MLLSMVVLPANGTLLPPLGIQDPARSGRFSGGETAVQCSSKAGLGGLPLARRLSEFGFTARRPEGTAVLQQQQLATFFEARRVDRLRFAEA